MEDLRDFKDKYDDIEDMSDLLQNLDIENPQNNVIPESATTFELLSLQSEISSKTFSEALRLMQNLSTESSQEQKDLLKDLAERNNLVSRMIQSRTMQKGGRAKGSYFNQNRKPICEIPKSIESGTKDDISDSALKLISHFLGDSDDEADNLRSFLRNLYDVACTNRLTEKCTKAVLRRKLQGTARRLIDAYEQELNTPNRPSLHEIVMKLEDRYLADLQPELANARLLALKKTADKTYQKLEGEINELVALAARGQSGDTTDWSNHRKIESFKQAICEADRGLIYQENMSRNITGLPELSLSKAVDFLIKTKSEQNAFIQSQRISQRAVETDSVYAVREETTSPKKETKNKPKTKAAAKKAQEEEKIKEELFQLYEKRKANDIKNKSRGNPPRRGKGYNQRQRNQNFRQNSYGKSRSNTIPRKFITPEMANVQPYNCLKCNSPDHRFQETHKCIYGNSNLMNKPCFNCGEGAHLTSLCIKGKNSTLGAPAPAKTPLDHQFSTWPETSKQAQEVNQVNTYSYFNPPKNDWLPSLFPN